MKSEYKLLKNKWFLYVTEFFAGVSVMAVELGASRLLAPYFSSSQIVWTIIIGTIMIAMALGNLYGGRAADKNPDPARLYLRILIAAVWIAAIPVLGKYLIIAISGLLIFTVSTNFLVIAAFASCMLIFVFPLFLLGTVTPSLVKFTVGSLDDSGRTVGRLGACNTVGSILGTFLPTFVTIPAVGTAVTFLIFSGVLLLIALAFFLSERRRLRAVVIALILFILCTVFGRSQAFAFWEDELSYEGESVYNYLQVREDEERVVLSTNVLFGVQSVMMKEGGLTGLYYDYALAAPVMSGRAAPRVLVLGNGTGTYARQCLEYFPGCTAEGVEIDGKITALAGEYFALPAAVTVAEYDGRAWLAAVSERYDVILVDAYQDITIPFQMSSAEFFTMVREHLAEGGVMVVNMNMHADGEDSINAWLCDTIASVFPHVAVADVPGSTNRELFASLEAEPAALLERGLEKLPEGELAGLMERVLLRLEPYEGGGRVLTDDRAPVELLGMRVIDAMIADELSYYKAVYAEEGISGVLGSFG
ncbi:MAG: fused MFS/spermidine synthase [Oscillospiraceae bacterium]|nr:fused MFS/spermidine synthase [Oscillospiraceae bacterium]